MQFAASPLAVYLFWDIINPGTDQKVGGPSELFSTMSREMAAWIYIDANKFLDFYRVNDQAVIATLTALGQVAGSVFVTSQIVGEVNRNKLQVALKHMGAFRSQYEAIQLDPEPWYLHKESTKTGAFKVKKHSTLKSELADKIESFAMEVTKSTDVISKHLKPVFDSARDSLSKEAILSKARLRRELGHPPGKKGDPLGDQLSWEQLLDALVAGDQLWVVSADSDYSCDCGSSRFLNPYLMNDVVTKTRSSDKVYCFDNLADALADFKKRSSNNLEQGQEKDLNEAATAEREVKQGSRAVVTTSVTTTTTTSNPNMYTGYAAATVPVGITSPVGFTQLSTPSGWAFAAPNSSTFTAVVGSPSWCSRCGNLLNGPPITFVDEGVQKSVMQCQRCGSLSSARP